MCIITKWCNRRKADKMNQPIPDSRLGMDDILADLHIKHVIIVPIIEEALKNRGVAPRSSDDDLIFYQFNRLIALGIQKGLQRYLIDVFRDIEEVVVQFEKDNSTEVHKGSAYFNVGLCYLWSGDFDYALYYWSKADAEDVATYGAASGDIFHTELFKKNFGNAFKSHLDSDLSNENAIWKTVIGHDFNYDDFELIYKNSSTSTLINLIINIHKYIRYSLMEDNKASHDLHLRLVLDFTVLFESSIKEYLRGKSISAHKTFGKLLNNNLTGSVLGDISASRRILEHGAYQCSSIADYNALLAGILHDIDHATTPVETAALVLHLICMTRNQVAHNLADNTITIYGDIALCRRLIRLILIFMMFNEYI